MLQGPGRSETIIGPAGQRMTIHDLPPSNTTRWVVRRKAEVVAAVRQGLITLEEACARYRLSSEELLSWERVIESHGLRGLRVTRLQQYRRPLSGHGEETAVSVRIAEKGGGPVRTG